ncbi:MAG: hypothetical protein ACNS62_05085 [Candidatus Cyclobacteriaceae bacterium M3_2C_046]
MGLNNEMFIRGDTSFIGRYVSGYFPIENKLVIVHCTDVLVDKKKACPDRIRFTE